MRERLAFLKLGRACLTRQFQIGSDKKTQAGIEAFPKSALFPVPSMTANNLGLVAARAESALSCRRIAPAGISPQISRRS